MDPRFPIYIVSKGRYETIITMKALDKMGVDYHVVVEPQEYDEYVKVVKGEILVLPISYQMDYDTFDSLGDSKSKGPGAARNFAWAHSMENGHDWHWVMDDNIYYFMRMQHNLKIRIYTGTFFRVMEDFVLRYENVGMAGPNYEHFVVRKVKNPPLILNTRIYSCNLIRNDVPYRWRGRYNEDTDLSLRMLKDGWCTIQFNAFLQKKAGTQTVPGGCSGEFYDEEGTKAKSEMQVKMHPDVSRLVKKFGRWHHQVSYAPFKRTKLIKKADLEISDTPNNYGMELVGTLPSANRDKLGE